MPVELVTNHYSDLLNKSLTVAVILVIAATIGASYSRIKQNRDVLQRLTYIKEQASRLKWKIHFGIDFDSQRQPESSSPATTSWWEMTIAWIAGRDRLPSVEIMSSLALEVSARLRAGDIPMRAWERSWQRRDLSPFKGVDAVGAPINLCQTVKKRQNNNQRQMKNGGITISDHLRISINSGGRTVDVRRSGARALVMASRFSFISGSPLADVLEQVSEAIVQAVKAHQAQTQAFTGPKLSATVLSFLPVLAIFLGELVGAKPFAWLFGSGIGRLCGVAGILFLLFGQLSSRKLITAAQNRSRDEIEATILCDLACAGLRSGVAIPSVLVALGKAADCDYGVELQRISKELIMGAQWVEAWEPVPPASILLYQSLQPGWEHGVSPVGLLQGAAKARRDQHVAKAEEDAAKLAVKLVLPLGIFLLPAFVLLGIVPIIFALINGQLGLM